MTGFKTLFLAVAVAGSMVNAQTISADMINAVAKDNQECKVGEVDEQCVPASEIPPFLEASFKTYNICSKNVMAAVTALISLESGSFRYKENKFPGRPGQGTANMQMIDFNKQYMDSIPELAGKWDDTSNATIKASLELLTDNKYNFGSAAWYLTTHKECVDANVQEALRKNPDEGWTAYMKCVGVDGANQERMDIYTAAKTAFGSVADEPECSVSDAGSTTTPGAGAAAIPTTDGSTPGPATTGSNPGPVANDSSAANPPPNQSSAASSNNCKRWRRSARSARK